MQVLPKLHEEIIKDDNEKINSITPSKSLLPITLSTTSPMKITTASASLNSPNSPTVITTTTVGSPHETGDEPYDQCYDSDIEEPLGWSGATKDTLQEGQIIKAGYLMKKGERLKIWKKKWFVLRTSKLAYYKDSKEYELLRITDIRDVHKAAEVPVKHKSGVFVILTPQRTFTVQAKDVAEMRDWVQAINQAKIQFEFAASSSDLESYAGSTAQLAQLGDPSLDSSYPQVAGSRLSQLQQQQQQQAAKQEMILPRRQQHKTLSLSDPDLLEKREKSRIKGRGTAPPTPTSTPQSPLGFPASSVSSILDRPTYKTPRAAEGLTLITSGTQAMQISSSSSPRMEQVHSTEAPVGSFSSDHSIGTSAIVPGTPSSPGGYYSGGELFWASHDHNLSSGEEDVADDDPSILEAGRLATEANAPGSGIVTDEQLDCKLVRQGYLYKLGNKYKTWRKKWFVLRGDKLTYYKNTKEYQPHGIIPLSTIIDCLQTDPVSKSKQYCLRIVTVKRSFVCSAPDEDTLLQWLDALHVECDRVANEARREEIADNQAHQGSDSLQEGHEGDDEDQVKPLGRTARLKLNLHSSLPRSRSRSKSGDGTGLFGSSANSTGSQIRKVLSLDSGSTTPLPSPSTLGGGVEKRESMTNTTISSPNVTFQIPTGTHSALPTPGATVTL
ncbi:hypothetical protein BGX27_009175 [Mortierella sp. AM989]|nr:hypothetical protein BGX27_009175 [Mortierella sp. AM989]